jgi:RNA recognition motif-containing protein
MENSRIFVANIAYHATEQQLADFFAQCGDVVSVKIIADRDTGDSKGFGFVEMGSAEEARFAIGTLNNEEFAGRRLSVKEAEERPAASAARR